jgi:hypothetical protein
MFYPVIESRGPLTKNKTRGCDKRPQVFPKVFYSDCNFHRVATRDNCVVVGEAQIVRLPYAPSRECAHSGQNYLFSVAVTLSIDYRKKQTPAHRSSHAEFEEEVTRSFA